MLSVLEWNEKTGDLLQSREKKAEDDALTFKADGWFVRQTGDDAIEISYKRKSKKMGGVQLACASETKGKLILSLKTGETQYGIILDKQLDEIANLPGFCEATPDGMLLFDDQQGNLRKGPLYSVEDLRTLANQKLETEIK